MPKARHDTIDDGTGSFDTYLEYNRVLRTWFVAFGVGGPYLFLSNPTIAQQLTGAHELRRVVFFFLLGAAAQVIGAFINKIANWYVYAAEVDGSAKGAAQIVADWLIDQFWIDVLLDCITIAAFGCASWVLLSVFAAS